MKEKLLKYQNGKLHHQLIFSIPAGKDVCGMECPGCYAMKFQRLYPNVLPYRERMLAYSKQDAFVDQIVQEIISCKKPLVAVRIHESGEFYSQDYIDKWVTIAKALPTVKFYTFTKRLKDFNFSKMLNLPNFVVIDSLAFNGLNYAKLEDLDRSKMICPSTLDKTKKCGIDCDYCWTKQAQIDSVQFVKH